MNGRGSWKMFGIPKEVFRDLLQHYQKAGVDAVLLEEDSPETIDKETAIKIGGRKFDLVILKFAGGSIAGGGGGGFGPTISKSVKKTHPNLRFHHVVRGMGQVSENDLKAETKEKKEGFISKKLVDVRWEGGRLADLLNGDAELKNMIMRTGSSSLKVESDKKNDCVRIIHEKGIDVIVESGGAFIHKTETRAENFPPIETLDIVDRIAERVKSL
jgi:hypothetical protein